MAIDNLDMELDAIKKIIMVLEPLDKETITFVLDTVFRKLNIIDCIPMNIRSSTIDVLPSTMHAETKNIKSVHIKYFKEEKQPSSDIEMAAIVAFYLENCVSENEKKFFITTKDLETQFKIAEYKLPSQIRFTLNNAKKAGYFDLVKDGEYKLNAIGYNLVAHSLPKTK